MACGNNKVSWDGLRTKPASPLPPAVAQRTVSPQIYERQASAIASVKAANTDLRRSASRRDVERAVGAAQDALRDGRRAGLSRDQLRALERDVDTLKAEARRELARLEAADAHQRRMTHEVSIDRLAPRALGVPVYRITTASLPTKALPPLPASALKPNRPRDEAVAKPRAAVKTQSTDAGDRALINAEKAARESSHLSLEQIAAAKKDAQREQSALSRLSPPPVRDIERLKESIKTLQRAESRARTLAATAGQTHVGLQQELAQLRSPGLDRQASRQQVGDFSEAVAAGFVHVLLDYGLLSQHNDGDKPQGLDIVAVGPDGQVVTFEVKGTALPNAGKARTSSTKTGRQGGADWIHSRSKDSPVNVESASAVGEAADQVASRLIRVDIAAGEIAVLAVDEKGIVSDDADFTASLDDVVAALHAISG